MEQECKLIREKECDGEVLKHPAFACRETALVRATNSLTFPTLWILSNAISRMWRS